VLKLIDNQVGAVHTENQVGKKGRLSRHANAGTWLHVKAPI